MYCYYCFYIPFLVAILCHVKVNNVKVKLIGWSSSELMDWIRFYRMEAIANNDTKPTVVKTKRQQKCNPNKK